MHNEDHWYPNPGTEGLVPATNQVLTYSDILDVVRGFLLVFVPGGSVSGFSPNYVLCTDYVLAMRICYPSDSIEFEFQYTLHDKE